MKKKTRPPWKKANPRKKAAKLSPQAKSTAKKRAKRAGRSYPNLVDNMRATVAQKEEDEEGRITMKRPGPNTLHRGQTTKDPKGGLTAAGRREFSRKQNAKLKPGVKKPIREMSPQEMRRKGSWAVRFYGRKGSLPPLVDGDGKPTRFALTAAAWGEPIPKTVSAARKIAEKGRRLLNRYQRSVKSSKT